MVTTVVARPPIVQDRSGSLVRMPGASPSRAANGTRITCPRCETVLSVNYDESICMVCGYVDHQYSPVELLSKRENMVSSGTRYVLRYVGEFPSLRDTLAHVKLQRLRNRIVFGVSCPFCDKSMMQSSLSGKRREVREERYKCTEGHRVSLTPTKNGALGWK